MRRGRLLLLLIVLVLPAGAARARVGEPPSRAQRIADAITELDVERGQKLLEEADSDSPTLSFERARLSIYRGDCDSARAILSAPAFSSTPEGAALAGLAESCARATAGGVVVEDKPHGVWLRLQDDKDRVLAPFIVKVAVAAREQVRKDLGVDLPRPLRIDLVRDLFSLSAVSGLPLSAAETTGTVAVARWGRVTMISPRATRLGYPWQDTLAHEITHLALSRATRDHAPLWLQEGVAKREESRWRKANDFDDKDSATRAARTALLTGRSVGVDKLGPSIAMLPTPEAASTAFSEVTSFIDYWVETNGEAALQLLLIDLKGVGAEHADRALVSVSGYGLSEWIVLWQRHLLELDDEPQKRAHPPATTSAGGELLRRVRLGDLLDERGHPAGAAHQYEQGLVEAPNEAAIRWRVARAHLGAGALESAKSGLATPAQVSGIHGGWFAIHGRFLQDSGQGEQAEEAFRLAISADPLLEDAACEGQVRVAGKKAHGPLPKDPARRALCESVRKLDQD